MTFDEYYLKEEYKAQRPDPLSFAQELEEFDVISFDVFDTALIRSVYAPVDVFRLVGLLIGDTRFAKRRAAAEGFARQLRFEKVGDHEVNLTEIYDVYSQHYGGDIATAMALEERLEKLVARQNKYIHTVYEYLRTAGKTLVFVSDMYLPSEVIEELLRDNGYAGFEFVWVSNEKGGSKADGRLPQLLAAQFPGKLIAHVGDNEASDVRHMREAGIAGFYYPDIRGLVPAYHVESISRSFYESIIAEHYANKTDSDTYFDYGYRVGGILAAGFAEFIEHEAIRQGVDKILFCGRDCHVIQQAYEILGGSLPNAYIEVSRRALDAVTLESNYDDFIGRAVLPFFDTATAETEISDVLLDAGLGFLVANLKENSISPSANPAEVSRDEFTKYLWLQKPLVIEHYRSQVEAAKVYFGDAIGDSQKLLVVDVGWSGSVIRALRQFVAKEFPERDISLSGALMCTSSSDETIDAISNGELCAYVYSPFENNDLLQLFHHPTIPPDYHFRGCMMLEYTFTSVKPSVVGYGLVDGTAAPIYGNNSPTNPAQIARMHDGIIRFVEDYEKSTKPFRAHVRISPYDAFGPFRWAATRLPYAYRIFKDFRDDVLPSPLISTKPTILFAEKFPEQHESSSLVGAA